MNKSLNAVLAGVAVATVGTTIAASPAQAFLNGSLAIDGVANFNTTDPFPMMDTIGFEEERIVNATGDFTMYPENTFNIVEVNDLAIDYVIMQDADTALYEYNSVMPFLEFNDGVVFNLDPGQIERTFFGTAPGNANIILNAGGLRGTFMDMMTNEVLGAGFLTAQTTGVSDFNITISSNVPEPLTILGTGLALGFGTLFKKSQGAKKEQEVAKN